MKPSCLTRWLECCVGLLLLGGARLAAAPPEAMPYPVNEAETAHYRWLRKPVLATRLLDDMEGSNAWAHSGPGTLGLTTARAKAGRQSLRLTSPTQVAPPRKLSGRPGGEAAARFPVAAEDWTNFNRLSFWVYPHLPGFKVISLLVKLHNQGATKVPDAYNREGLNYVLLTGDQWNQVVWEIPHLARDRVTGIDLIYRLQGNEPGATNVVCFDFDQLELQRVQPDAFEGWAVAPGQIAFSHSGYGRQSAKIALASDLPERVFKVVRCVDGRAVLTQPVQTRRDALGEFQALDFSQADAPGLYRLECGPARTPWFTISASLEAVWEPSIWKTINFFYAERCGDAIPGIHEVCHRDWRARHDGKEIFINGGWHDAGDLSQGLVNTAEATYAMLDLAARCRESRPALARRLIDEARWGLAWINKTRFGDGFRLSWATMDYWTDGVLGTVDDTFGDARNSPFDNFLAAAAEALAAQVLQGADPALAANNLRLAREDWKFGVDKLQAPNLELAAAAALASLELFHATHEPPYAEQALALAPIILASQQRTYPDWQVPLTGFFYTGPKRERILHYAHRGHEQAPVVALAGLCEAFPEHPEWMRWYSAVALHSEYLKRLARFTEPYGMLPASIYSLNESNDPRFQEQVRQGVKLSEQHFLRRFPVWFDFRGNLGTLLSQTKALSTAARLRGDAPAAALVQRQLQWTVGRNPFCQSLMYGEGHDYAPQYTAMSGNIVGSLPVGIQTREHYDRPYWPAANCYNYKEVWVHPSSRWLWILADVLAAPSPSSDLQLEFSGQSHTNGSVELKLVAQGRGAHRFAVRAANLRGEFPEQPAELNPGQPRTLTWTAAILSPQEPWVAVLIPDGHPAAKKDVIGVRSP